MSIDDLCYMSAHEALKRFRNLSLSPVELVDAILKKANSVPDTVNPSLIAILKRLEKTRKNLKPCMRKGLPT